MSTKVPEPRAHNVCTWVSRICPSARMRFSKHTWLKLEASTIMKNGLISRLIDGEAEVIRSDIMCDSVGLIPFCSPRYELISPSDLIRAFITSLFLHWIIMWCPLHYCHQPLFRGRTINLCITILVGQFAQLVCTVFCRLVTFLSSFLSSSCHTLDEA